MTKTAQLLADSRRAHRAGREASKQRDLVSARAQFQQALLLRLDARAGDPGYTDHAWADDLKGLHSRKELDRDLGRRLHVKDGDAEPEGYATPATRQQPGASVVEMLRQADADLEGYYRHQLGEATNRVSRVDTSTPGAVTVPTAWQTTVAGTKDDCRCVWQMMNEQHRRCVACGQQQQLRPTMAAEDTQAHQQLQKEGDTDGTQVAFCGLHDGHDGRCDFTRQAIPETIGTCPACGNPGPHGPAGCPRTLRKWLAEPPAPSEDQ